MSALICGSLAFDTIMVFNDRFKNHILPDQVHILNVSFLVPQLRREFGGCAGNIAFNLKMLGGDPMPMGAVGKDFDIYRDWLTEHGIRLDAVKQLNDHYTAQAYITTDQDDNQITAFHPGAMSESHQTKVADYPGVTLGIIAPDGRDGMLQHAAQFAEAGIPFIFDPGQAMPLFDGEEFRQFVEQAEYVCVNDYESRLLEQRTGWSHDDIASRCKAYIVTRGAEGAWIFSQGEKLEIPPVKPADVVDPTGCGDAFRAGLIRGLMAGLDLAVCGRMASLMGSIKVAHAGTQNHRFTLDEFKQQYQAAFAEPLALD
jgi:adenosine kinase